jgi:hypothetical protein
MALSLKQYCNLLSNDKEYLETVGFMQYAADEGVRPLFNTPILLAVSIFNNPFETSVIGFADSDETLSTKYSDTHAPGDIPFAVSDSCFMLQEVDIHVSDENVFVPPVLEHRRVRIEPSRIFIATLNLATQELQYHNIVV